jgi:magnesium and cobalt exporter, CNNM family
MTGAEASAAPADQAAALLVLCLATGFALVFAFFCSISEAVILSVSHGHVEKLAKSGSRAGRILRDWKRSGIEEPIAAILIVNTVALTAGATVAGLKWGQAVDPDSVGIFSAGLTVAILIFSEVIPKTLGVNFAHVLATPVVHVLRVIVWILWPVLRVTGGISRMLIRGKKSPGVSIEEIRLLAALGSREGDVGPRYAQFIEGIVSLRELTVRDVMVPRVAIGYLSGVRSFEENLATVRQSGHSRFPFTPSGELDDVDGMILAKDLLFLDDDEDEPDWNHMKQPLLVVPEGKQLDEALRLFQDQRKHMAVVVDEYGGTQGVITLEDVLEEIVGEIEDETDRIETLIQKKSDGTFECRGWAETRKLFQVIGIEAKVDFVTVGGLVADLLGRVPQAADRVTWKNLRFHVTKASKRRAERIVVTILPKLEDETTHDELGAM